MITDDEYFRLTRYVRTYGGRNHTTSQLPYHTSLNKWRGDCRRLMPSDRHSGRLGPIVPSSLIAPIQCCAVQIMDENPLPTRWSGERWYQNKRRTRLWETLQLQVGRVEGGTYSDTQTINHVCCALLMSTLHTYQLQPDELPTGLSCFGLDIFQGYIW